MVLGNLDLSSSEGGYGQQFNQSQLLAETLGLETIAEVSEKKKSELTFQEAPILHGI